MPGISLPVITNVQAGSWLIASVLTVLIIAMSSAIVCMCGTNSLIMMPLCPHGLNSNLVGATGKPRLTAGHRGDPLVIADRVGKSLSK